MHLNIDKTIKSNRMLMEIFVREKIISYLRNIVNLLILRFINGTRSI
jgi:hypothetical protein